ncbi:MAG: glycerol kinase GlpK [Lachnospiraceae bacterium oral taxon 082]|nr:glycerol kinase GlpK [Lachnospiraceae bacterium oral taxon 082]
MDSYVLSVDQSTQGTKALLFDGNGKFIKKTEKSHKQYINDKGYVEHDPIEIYRNTIEVIGKVIDESGIDKSNILCFGISNQRETILCWDKYTLEPLYNAIVWQCSRAKDICDDLQRKGYDGYVKESSGMQLSPYFSAAKLSWMMKNVDKIRQANVDNRLCIGTVDTWLVYKFTNGRVFATDYSNASRTQLLNIDKLTWDKKLCDIFGVDINALPQVLDSNAYFGDTDFDGILDKPIKIKSVMGDSHAALFAQHCNRKGMVKATYGTGSSIMMNVGTKRVKSKNLVSSIGWSIDNDICYVLEGNINYAGAILSWLKNDLELIDSPEETERLAKQANSDDTTYIIPAFSGLGAPYWKSNAKAVICGMSRITGKAEIVRSALDCIAYQIMDILENMSSDSGIEILELRVDGGPTKNKYLMQFQSDVIGKTIKVSEYDILSGMGAAFMAGISEGIYGETVFNNVKYNNYIANVDNRTIIKKEGWKEAIKKLL